MDIIVRVDLTTGTIATEPVADKYKKLGGRALTAQILTDEVEPGCEPLGKRNKLVFAPGLLGGSFLSSSSRLSVGGKSPLTGGIKEANAGGTAAVATSILIKIKLSFVRLRCPDRGSTAQPNCSLNVTEKKHH